MGNFTIGGITLDSNQFSAGFDITEFDFKDHRSNVQSVWTANITLITLVGIFVGLRIFVRSYFLRRLFLDDVFIIVASVFTIALASVCLAATNDGLGTHVWLLPVATVFDKVTSCIQYLFICQVLYACAIAFTKIAIIASYMRFIPERKFRIALIATGAVVVGLWMTGIFVTIFQCSPISGAWDYTVKNRKCIAFINYLYASSAISVTTDIILCILPWPYLWALRMPVKQKLILCVLLGGGVGASLAGILRISKLYTLRSVDVTFRCVPCLILSVVECSVGIICVSIPPLRPLLTRIFPTGLQTAPSCSEKSALHSLTHQKRASIALNQAQIQLPADEDIDSNIAQIDFEPGARSSAGCESYETQMHGATEHTGHTMLDR